MSVMTPPASQEPRLCGSVRCCSVTPSLAPSKHPKHLLGRASDCNLTDVGKGAKTSWNHVFSGSANLSHAHLVSNIAQTCSLCEWRSSRALPSRLCVKSVLLNVGAGLVLFQTRPHVEEKQKIPDRCFFFFLFLEWKSQTNAGIKEIISIPTLLCLL